MKKTLFILLTICFAMGVMAQEQSSNDTQEYKTLFGGDKVTHGGYGGLAINYSQLDGSDALLIGAKGAWIINHGIGIGIGGYGITNDITYDLSGSIDEYQLAGGYGGLLIEPIIGAKWPVHIALPVLVGAGGISYVYNNWTSGSPSYENSYYSLSSDAFFVVEPGLEIELNLVKFFRIAFGAYYRYTSDVDLSYYVWDDATAENVLVNSTPDLKGFSFGATLKFGKF